MVRVGRHLLAGTYLTAYRTALAVAPALYRDSKRKVLAGYKEHGEPREAA